MITLGKRGDLHARRQAAAFVRNEVASVREENEEVVIESALQNYSMTSLLVTQIAKVATLAS